MGRDGGINRQAGFSFSHSPTHTSTSEHWSLTEHKLTKSRPVRAREKWEVGRGACQFGFHALVFILSALFVDVAVDEVCGSSCFGVPWTKESGTSESDIIQSALKKKRKYKAMSEQLQSCG